MHKRILTILLVLVLVATLAVETFATEEETVPMPDLSQKGSLTLILNVGGEPLDSGKLNLYHVATVTKVTEQQYDFRLLDKLTAAGATLNTNHLYDNIQALELLVFAQDVLDQYLTCPIEDGKAHFEDLQTGLYLVWQSSEDASEGYDAILPFLISVPKWQNGNYELDVEAAPKVPLETEPTEPTVPPPSPPPDLPQTGQLNWPIPLMAVSGGILLFVGLILCARRKRCDHEK